MRIGLSSYSLVGALRSGEFTLVQAIDWAAKNGADVFELVPIGFTFMTEAGKVDLEQIKATKQAAKDAGIPLVNYSVGGNLLQEGEAQQKEIARIKQEVDIAAELGLDRMRHDIGFWASPLQENTTANFDQKLPGMLDAVNEISEHGKTRGVVTMLENHGLFVNGMDRVQRVINGVHTGNYGLLMDTGNIICVDEDPLAFVRLMGRQAKMVHLKDFYVRASNPGDTAPNYPNGAWFRSLGGTYLRGAILGQGDLDVRGTIKTLKELGYTGDVAIEFEGMEECRYASAVSIANAKRILAEV